MKFYIIYEEYEEHNQFEGEWTLKFSEFSSKKQAEMMRELYLKDSDIRKVSKILQECQ